MKIKITDYICQHFSTISKILDVFAFIAFAFAAVLQFSSGNISAAAANCCAIAWVFIARTREDSSEFYAAMYYSIRNAYDSLKNEYNTLKAQIKDLTKDKANDCSNCKD